MSDDVSYLKRSSLNHKIGDENTQPATAYYIIDNTFYPCSKGVFLP